MNDYHLSNMKWGTGEYGTPGGQVYWSFATGPGEIYDFDGYITNAAYRTAVREAFDAWESVADIDFVEVPDGAQTDIHLGWNPIDGTYGVVGTASSQGSKTTATLFSFTVADIQFDQAETWTADHDVGRSEVGFYQVALHEIGHAIGLDHTDDPDTIMYASDISGLSGLTATDIAAARALYGAARTTPPPVADPAPAPQPDPGTVSPVAVYAASQGNDVFVARAGNDIINGMGGTDTLSLTGDISQYTLTLSPGATILVDRVAGRDGNDVLVSIEKLDFGDGSVFDIGIRSGATDLSAEDFAAITELYVAYFDRAPASKGLMYWATRLEDGMSLPEIAESFFVQPETQATYAAYLDGQGGIADVQGFVTSVFNNVLGRNPSSDYWVRQLETNPDITPGVFILAVLNGAKAVTGGAADAAYLEAKTDIGVYFSAIKGLSDYDDTVAVMEMFDGSAASLDAAVSQIDQLYTQALDAQNGDFLMPLVGVIDDPFAIA